MYKPNARKTSFSKQKVFVIENVLPSFVPWVIAGLPSEANCWIIFLKQSWVSLRDELLDHYPRQFFGKSSLEIPFTTIFHFSFLSCHALTPNFLGCPGAYGMHYAISKKFMLIYQACINMSYSHCMLFIQAITHNKVTILDPSNRVPHGPFTIMNQFGSNHPYKIKQP